MSIVRAFYDDNAEREWRRLTQNAYHRLEYVVTMHFLKKYLPPSGRVLDAGGGPGRYSIELAKQGYDVVLFDLSPRCLELSKSKAVKAHVKDKVKQIEGSITDLSIFKDREYDAVLCLGPLSHLLERKEREKAASEIVRVTKKGSPVFISVIGLYGVLRTVLQRLPHELTEPSHEEMFRNGVHRWHENRHKGVRGFPDAYFWHPKDLKELFEAKGVKTLEMATCEGLSSHLQRPTNRLYRDKKKWAKWKDLILKTCNDPMLLGMGEHFLYVGRSE